MKSKYTVKPPTVHIVTNMGEGWIIPKFMRNLSELTGWTLSNKPKDKVEINYFYPYYNYEDCKTLTAAFFTHKEEHPDFERRKKEWETAAKKVSLRIAHSFMYADMLVTYGPTEVIIPAVDNLAANWSEPNKKIIGICGRNYPSNRKGKDLIRKLLEHEISEYIELRFAGFGWQDLGPTKKYKDEDMDKFYRGLDYYLCTSTIEGGPMSVLEAEILGIPSIAPRGVGFCEEFASYLYEKSDLNSLVGVLEQLVVPRFKLTDFNKKAWASRHISVFTALARKEVI